MKTRFILLCLILHLPAWADDEATLRQIKEELWPTAYRTQDSELLGSILHETFQLIDGAGNLSDRTKEMAWVQDNPWNPPGFVYRIKRLDIYDGGFAIVAGTGEADAFNYRSSNVFVKEDGEWKAIASHISGFQSK